tara:strand:- start:184 stop:840 length:657 start_codon:yes stop_codon:yes gene_type:complete
MDIKTIQKVINGQEDKLQELEKKINDNNDYKKLWEENTTHYNDLARMRLNDTIEAKKIEALEDRVEFNINERITKLEELETSIKNSDILFSDAVRKIFARMDSTDENINRLDDRHSALIGSNYDKINDCNAKIDNVLSAEQTNYSHINGINDRLEDRVLIDDYDRLEAKYYTLRSELDSIYKVLEMDALDIQDLYNKLENHPKKNNINLTKKEGCNDE